MVHHPIQLFDSDDEEIDRIAAVVVVALEAEGFFPAFDTESRESIIKALIRVVIGMRTN